MFRPLIPLLKPVDRLLQLCLPASPRRITYLSRPDYCDNSYHIYRHILTTRNGIEHVWPLMDMSMAERISREFQQLVGKSGTTGNTLRVVPRGTLTAYRLFLGSRCVFSTHGIYPVTDWAWRRHFVCLWHGMPIKCVGRLNHRSPRPTPVFGSTHVATSHFFRYIIACSFGVGAERVLVSGLPRCDALTHDAAVGMRASEVRKRLGIAEDSKLVLWLPTYRTEGMQAVRGNTIRSFLDDLDRWVLPALARHSRLNNCTLVTKLHPRDPLNYHPVESVGDSIRMLTHREWLKHEIHLYDLIAASDALLSDVSSVLIDYLVTGRPIGIVGFDPETYTRDLTFPAGFLRSSKRFHHLDSDERAQDFFAAVAAAGHQAHPADDIASVFYDHFPEPSSEAICQTVGI